jgi:3'-phosphoadenosine 5'-phosphosulfate sulfotransferase (PAPS reductase)/FAD synthetase
MHYEDTRKYPQSPGVRCSHYIRAQVTYFDDVFRTEELSISYNGGKDCLVLLILYLTALSRHAAKTPSFTFPRDIQSVYIISSHPFPEVGDFVSTTTKTYQLDLTHYSLPMQEAFSVYLKEFPKVKAIFVGTRRTDPHGGNLTFFDRTDHGWPDFMRIHPVIDWHYVEIWSVSAIDPCLFGDGDYMIKTRKLTRNSSFDNSRSLTVFFTIWVIRVSEAPQILTQIQLC